MPSRRLQRLAALTQGLALVGLGVSASACNNDPPHVNSPPQPPVMNAPVEQPGGDASALGPDHDASTTPPVPVVGDAGRFIPPHTVNAPPKGWNPPPVSSAKP